MLPEGHDPSPASHPLPLPIVFDEAKPEGTAAMEFVKENCIRLLDTFMVNQKASTYFHEGPLCILVHT